MGLQAALIKDLSHSIREAGRHELLMNAAGQVAGMLQRKRPARVILEEMVKDATEILASTLSARVTASL